MEEPFLCVLCTGETPLHLAARYSRSDAAKRLLDAGADPNVQDNLGRTPLHSAVAADALGVFQVSFASVSGTFFTSVTGNLNAGPFTCTTFGRCNSSISEELSCNWSLVDSAPFVRRVTGSNPALAAT